MYQRLLVTKRCDFSVKFSNIHTIPTRFYFISSVVKRCMPRNISELIDVALENRVSLNETFHTNDVMGILREIQRILDFEGVSYER